MFIILDMFGFKTHLQKVRNKKSKTPSPGPVTTNVLLAGIVEMLSSAGELTAG